MRKEEEGWVPWNSLPSHDSLPHWHTHNHPQSNLVTITIYTNQSLKLFLFLQYSTKKKSSSFFTFPILHITHTFFLPHLTHPYRNVLYATLESVKISKWLD